MSHPVREASDSEGLATPHEVQYLSDPMKLFALGVLLLVSMLRAQDEPAPAQTPRGPQAAPFDLDTAFVAAIPPVDETRWTLIPWRHSLTEALAEAKTAHKPVYLFVNDGDVGSGRC
jgi:hypothetical protein